MNVVNLKCFNNCYLYEGNDTISRKWCQQRNIPQNGICQTDDINGCVRGHINLNHTTTYFQTCGNKSPVSFDFSKNGKCTRFSNFEENNILTFPNYNVSRIPMKFKACKCYGNLCNSGEHNTTILH